MGRKICRKTFNCSNCGSHPEKNFDRCVAPFIEKLGDRFVSISEHTQVLHQHGDDGELCFVVFYWEEGELDVSKKSH